jgi:hypothetical protein
LKTTFRSKLLIAALFCGITGAAIAAPTADPVATAPAIPVVANATAPYHIALAQAYIDIVPIEDDVKAAVEQMAQRVKQDQRVLFRSLADSTIDYAKLKNAAVTQVANQFTDDEIKAMTKFFGSAEGKSIRKKLPTYEASMQPAMFEALQGFVMKLKENNISVDLGQ